MKPKIIAILRSGLKPRKAVRVLLNNRNTKSFETLLGDLTNTVKLDTGAVRKIFTLDGKPVISTHPSPAISPNCGDSRLRSDIFCSGKIKQIYFKGFLIRQLINTKVYTIGKVVGF